MRRVLLLSVLITVPLCRPSPAAAASDDPTAADLLSRAVAALGGEERLAAVEGWVREGRLEIQGLQGTYKEWAGKPDRLKYDVDLNIARSGGRSSYPSWPGIDRASRRR